MTQNFGTLITTLLLILTGIIETMTAQHKITLNDIHDSDKFNLKSIEGFAWIPKSAQFSYLEKNSITDEHELWSYDLASGAKKQLIDSEKYSFIGELRRENRFQVGIYSWSPTGQEILFPRDNQFLLFQTKDGTQRILADDASPKRDPQFSPDGKKMMYLKNHNLFVLDLQSGVERQMTTEGQENYWIGRFDWVYEEEFGIRTGFFWSPDNRHIAYFRVDARHETEFPIVDFNPTHNSVQMLRYPKAGDRNAIVKIGVVDIESEKTVWMDTEDEVDIYLPRIKWLPDGQTLAIYRLNRDQNQLDLLFANIQTGETKIILTEKETQGWLDVYSDLTFLKNKPLFLWRSDRSGYTHIYLYQINGQFIRQLTQGEWEAENILGVDEKKGFIYFMANRETPLEKHLYRIRLNGKDFQRLSAANLSHSIRFSPDFQFFIDDASNANLPTQTAIYKNDGSLVRSLEKNENVVAEIKKLPQKELLTFQTTDGVILNAFIIRPPVLEPEKKYPVLFTCYGGPGSQIVQNGWGRGDLWHRMLAQNGIIVFGVDNRGTGGRGAQFKKQVYRQLGEFEVTDHIEAVKFLRTLPYIDSERIGIWGWSYGGYTTCMCLLKGNDFFKLGVAVAPVTDWLNYDTIYTERYMDQPADNPAGYDSCSAVKLASQLQGKLLLIHGSADDNVHLSNTMQLVYELQKEGKQFDLMVYPQKDHGIGGVRQQLYESITNFIMKNL